MTAITTTDFMFDDERVRVAQRDGEAWFVAADVCAVLGLGNTSQALTRIDDDETTLIPNEALSGAWLNAVNESGLYSLVLGSRKPEAKRFKKWVTSKVLPSIRKTGQYGAASLEDPAALRGLLLTYAERVLAVEQQRDEAIKTKALIGSKREATAMATASAAKREANQLRDRLGECIDHATVTAVQNATGERFDWLPLRRWCKDQGITPATVPDKRYGDVKSWPRAAWFACHGVRLDRLFAAAVTE